MRETEHVLHSEIESEATVLWTSSIVAVAFTSIFGNVDRCFEKESDPSVISIELSFEEGPKPDPLVFFQSCNISGDVKCCEPEIEEPVWVQHRSLTNLQAASILSFDSYSSFVSYSLGMIPTSAGVAYRDRVSRSLSDPSGKYVIESIDQVLQIAANLNRLLANQEGVVRVVSVSDLLKSRCAHRLEDASSSIDSGPERALTLLTKQERDLAVRALAKSVEMPTGQAQRFFPSLCFVAFDLRDARDISTADYLLAMPRSDLQPLELGMSGFASELLGDCGVYFAVSVLPQ